MSIKLELNYIFGPRPGQTWNGVSEMKKKELYDSNGQYTEAGRNLAGCIESDLDEVIKKYSGIYDRIEFEHLIAHCLTFRLALHAINEIDWPKQTE